MKYYFLALGTVQGGIRQPSDRYGKCLANAQVSVWKRVPNRQKLPKWD
jgi:hypothetical protein